LTSISSSPSSEKNTGKSDFSSLLTDLDLASGKVSEIPANVLNAAYDELVSRANKRRSTELILKKGFQFNAKEKYLTIPKAFLTGDSTIAEIMLSCAKILDFRVTVYSDDKVNCALQNGSDNILLGLLYSIGGPRNTKLSHSKTGRDLGYAVGMSLRLKGEMKVFGLEGALRPNNFFFANNKEESYMLAKKRIPIQYGVKQTLTSVFVSPDAGTIFYKVIASTLMSLGIKDMTPNDQELIINANIITFDEFIKKNWIEVWSDNAKNPQLLQVRKATFPSRNSLLLTEELNVIQLLTKPFFSSVEDIRSDYLNLLYTHGYTGLLKLVTKRYVVRHTILQNIASMTTKRLQYLRRILNIADLKKKQVTRERLVTYLSNLQTPLENFKEELKKILSSEQRKIAFKVLAADSGIETKQCFDFLLSKVLLAYKNNLVYATNKQVPQVKTVDPDEDAINLYETTYKKVNSMKRKSDLALKWIKSIVDSSTASHRGLLYRKVILLIPNFTVQYKEVTKALLEKKRDFVKLLAFTVEYLESWTESDLDSITSMYNFLLSFKDNYLETNKTTTLPEQQDARMVAICRKQLESIRAPAVVKEIKL
jgi:hypothetical protein